MKLLKKLAKKVNKQVKDMLQESADNGIANGICTNSRCQYTANVEPDCEDGWCENCETQSVVSCLILAGII